MDKYLHYQIEDFVQDEDFIHWVRSDDPVLNEKWQDWLDHHADKKEPVRLAKMLLLSLREQNSADVASAKDRVWGKIDGQIEKNSTTLDRTAKVRPMISRRTWMSIAAAVALLIFSATFLLNRNNASFYTGLGEETLVTLPDQSTVTLNADSRITYAKKDWSANREVMLDGEAFFQVQKGSSFEVKTEQGLVSVLGTSFNVLARENQFKVFCKTGKVAVSTDKQEVILSPGEGINLMNSVLETTLDDTRLGWMNGRYGYQAERLENIISDIERIYDVEIIVPSNAANEIFTGGFTSDSLEQTLEKVCWPLNLKFAVDGRKVRITK